jgi:BirA family biotin operon repressor/biotin-[acetyl-CoA-carboxylase] ligase
VQFNNNSKLFHEEKWIILPTIPSTNTYAKELLSNSEPVLNGTVIMAVEQSSGRGQKNNSWISEPGKNLTFSIILDTAFLPLHQQFSLNQTVSLGILDFLQKGYQVPAFIKWPNDLYIEDRKIGGILIENIIIGNRHKHSVIGIGLNINQKTFPKNLDRATSLCLFTDQALDLRVCLKQILISIENRLDQLISTQSFLLEEDYQSHLLGKGQLRYFRHHDRIFQGTITGVNRQGELKILIQGKEEFFGLNELFFIF